MRRAHSIASFVADPVDRWAVAGSSIAWCRHSELAGMVAWGRPNVADIRAIVEAFGAVFGAKMGPKVDVVLDGRGIVEIDGEALGILLAWIERERDRLKERVRFQVGVIPEGIAGLTMVGILPALGGLHPFVVERDGIAAIRRFAPDEATRIDAELTAALADATGVDPLVRRLRDALLEKAFELSLADSARVLGLSTRTFQRSLKAAGTSFQDELKKARLAEAARLLRSTREKVSTIAARIGVSETTLHELVRDELGTTPAKLRAEAGS